MGLLRPGTIHGPYGAIEATFEPSGLADPHRHVSPTPALTVEIIEPQPQQASSVAADAYWDCVNTWYIAEEAGA